MKRIILILAILIVLVPNTSAQDEELDTWNWHEVGLSFEYPAGWQSSLTVENFAFVLFGEPTANGDAGFFISLQTGTYDPNEENLANIFNQIAGDEIELTETTLGCVEAWRFEVASEERRAVFYGFGANGDDLALLSLSAPAAQWEDREELVEQIVDSAVITRVELDHEALNEQMLQNYEDEGIIGLGNPNAPVRMVEFMDFSCPHCANFADSIDRIVQDYVVEDEIFLQFSVLDIIGGENSQVAALAQVCGTQLGIGWDTHELLFETFFEGGRDNYNIDTIVEVVDEAELAVSGDDFRTCMETEDAATFVLQNVEWAGDVGVSSTPSLMFGVEDTEDPELDFMRNSSGEPFTGSLPLVMIYEHLDGLLQASE